MEGTLDGKSAVARGLLEEVSGIESSTFLLERKIQGGLANAACAAESAKRIALPHLVSNFYRDAFHMPVGGAVPVGMRNHSEAPKSFGIIANIHHDPVARGLHERPRHTFNPDALEFDDFIGVIVLHRLTVQSRDSPYSRLYKAVERSERTVSLHRM